MAGFAEVDMTGDGQQTTYNLTLVMNIIVVTSIPPSHRRRLGDYFAEIACSLRFRGSLVVISERAIIGSALAAGWAIAHETVIDDFLRSSGELSRRRSDRARKHTE
jgi:hypothetical protein